eukprot:8712252-Ditylum_brightwellii.AAC.1
MPALTTTNPERCKRLDAKDDPMRSDTFAKHFQQHFPADAAPQQLHANLDLRVSWEGNPLSCVKTFQTAT